MAANEREVALETLIRGLQQEADMEVDVWREVGNAILAYTQAKKALRAKLMTAVEKLDGPTVQKPQPLPSRPANIPPDYDNRMIPNYEQQPYQPQQPYNQFPANSGQPAWPPADPPVPHATVPKHPNGGANPNGGWRLGDALRAASQGR